VRVQVDRRAWILAAILLLLIGALNFRALTSALPWMGDESSHIEAALRLARMVPLAWVAMGMAAFLFTLYIAWRRPRYTLASCAVLVVGCGAVYLLRQPPLVRGILRYPSYRDGFMHWLRPFSAAHRSITRSSSDSCPFFAA
jgi:hypothetical protein